MPFINTRTTVALSDAKKETLTAEIGRITSECLGKGENWIMTGSDGTSRMTAKICALLERELSIPASRIYVAYFPTNEWGWNGNNF